MDGSGGATLGAPLVAAMESIVMQQLNAQIPGITTILNPAAANGGTQKTSAFVCPRTYQRIGNDGYNPFFGLCFLANGQ
jgi:hypothetical protein